MEQAMLIKRISFLVLLCTCFTAVAENVERIVVTGSRIDVFNSPAVTIVKPADYLLQKVSLINDTRDEKKRTEELHETVRRIVKSANTKDNIEIAVGNEIIYPISLKNFQFDVFKGDRADTSVAYLYIKTPIKQGDKVETLINNLSSFIKKSKRIGRTEIEQRGELVLSIINPEKYRKELLELIAEDIKNTINIFGENYSVEIEGISQSLQWERASISELKLFLEYDFVLMSK